MKGKRKTGIIVLALILGPIFILSCLQVYGILKERKIAHTVYEDLDRFVQYPRSGDGGDGGRDGSGHGNGGQEESAGDGSEGQDGLGHEGGAAGAAEPLFPEIDFGGLQEINAQTVGWIYCEGTSISFPVVQGEDNDYYLKHMFNGKENPDGSIFLDCGNKGDFSDCHNIIYGHHMNSGAMFAPLLEYKRQEYYEEHPRMLLMTPEQDYIVEIFAGYVADVEADAWDIGFADSGEYGEWIERSVSSSWISADIVPGPSDKILTLSTCSYEFDNARFVLLGVMRPRE